MPLAFWICAAVTAVSAFVSLGFSIAGVSTATASNRTASLYTTARSIALAVVAVVSFFVGSVAFVSAIAIAMVLVQAIDAVIGGILRDRMKTIGPAITALVNLATLIWLLR